MDPGSTDGSRELLLKLKKEFNENLVLRFAPDNGQSDAINRGMALAHGTVLAWLNSDDRYHAGALQEIAAYLDSQEPRWMYGRCGIINQSGKQIFKPIVAYKNWRGRSFSIYKLLTEPYIPQMAVFWNRALWDMVGGVDISRDLDMDYDLFLHFARIAAPKISKTYFADSRVHPDAKSSTRTSESINAAAATAAIHACGLGIRGKCAVLFHKIYGLRTKIIYSVLK
jgi:glycosyltransferase involved in cell wall biosynthesis